MASWRRGTGASMSMYSHASKAIQHRANLVGRFSTGCADRRLKRTAHEDRSVEPMGRASPSIADEFTRSLSVLREAVCMREPRSQPVNHDAD